LKQEFEIAIRWTMFPLHPETPREGMSLEELFAGRDLDIDQVLRYLKAVADELGLPFGRREKTYNSRLAQELGKLAEQCGKGDAFHNAVFRAYFAHGHNIGLESTLMELARSLGLAAGEVRRALEKRSFQSAVDEDWRRSRRLGISVVPTCVFNSETVVGAQPYERLARMVEAGGAARRP